MSRPRIAATVGLIATLLAACNMPGLAISPTPPIVLTQPPFSVENTPMTEVYNDQRFGMVINYPQGWTVQEIPLTPETFAGQALEFYSWGFDPLTAGEGAPNPDQTRVSMIWLGRPDSLDALAESYLAPIKNPPSGAAPEDLITLLAEDRLTLASGVEAVSVKTHSKFGDTETILVIINGNGLSLFAQGNPAWLGPMVNTIRPAP